MIIFIHNQLVAEQVKKKKKNLTKVDENIDSNFNVRRLIVSLDSWE